MAGVLCSLLVLVLCVGVSLTFWRGDGTFVDATGEENTTEFVTAREFNTETLTTEISVSTLTSQEEDHTITQTTEVTRDYGSATFGKRAVILLFF